MIREDRYAYFETLFKECHRRLYFYAFNVLNDRLAAEDIVEDVFSYLWEHYDEVVGEASPLPLLYAWVRSRCIDHLRRCEVRERFREAAMQQPELLGNVEADAEHHERIGRVMKAMEELPAQTRSVFEACFLEGKKYKEVGAEMGISINTVKTYVTRALAFLRKAVQ